MSAKPIKKANNHFVFSGKAEIALTIALFFFIGYFFYQKIIFINADLGRHLANGREFVENGTLVSANYYSYTEPELEVTNHHWLTGVAFYLVWKMFDYAGLSVLNIVLNLTAVFLFFYVAKKKYGFFYAFVSLFFIIPLVTSRTEIRPESFSYLLMGLFFYLFYLFDTKRISFLKLVIVLLPLQILWANLHLFFVFGWFITFYYLLNSFVNKTDYRKYVYALILLILVSLVNPYGIKGVLEPFLIFKEYGYMVAENQSVFFMHNRFSDNPLYLHFEILASAIILTAVFLLLKHSHKIKLSASFFLLVTLTLLAAKMIRGIPVWGLFFIPVTAEWMKCMLDDYMNAGKASQIKKLLTALVIVVFLLGVFTNERYYHPKGYFSGVGLIKNVNKSAEFFKTAGIKGPVFNNYDIGSYLIFHLFPQEKVFVDNRPEAYTVSFFKNLYEPMQEKPEKWHEADSTYNFNCIYFFRHDNTPFAQPFLIERVKDPMWAPVFVDGFAIVFLKRNEQNAHLIKQFELPQSMFISVPGS